MHDRQKHDLCFAIAWRVLELVKPLLPEHDHRDFMQEVLEITRQEVENYERARARQEARLRPVNGGTGG
jgi:hypothetical protein